MGDLYTLTHRTYVYRIYDPKENKYCSSGHSLYGKGRSIWMNLGGATSAKNNMPDEIRDRLIILKYKLTLVMEE